MYSWFNPARRNLHRRQRVEVIAVNCRSLVLAEDWAAARRFFSREAVRANYSDEVHFWLSLANWRLGDMAEATKHLHLAVGNSTSRNQGQLCATKLRWLQAHLQRRSHWVHPGS